MKETYTNALVFGESKPGDHARADSFVDYAITHPGQNFRIYLTAGTVPFSGIRPLSKRMRDYIADQLIKKGGFQTYGYDLFQRAGQRIKIAYTENTDWGTLEEIYRLLELIGFNGSGEFLAFSSKSHLPRIIKIWKALGPGFTVTPMPTDGDMDDVLIQAESTKDIMTDLFLFIHRHFPKQTLFCISWLKNLVLNVWIAKLRGRYYP